MPLKPEQSTTMESNHDEFVKQFIDETGVRPATATMIWHLNQAYRFLYWEEPENFKDSECWEIEQAFRRVASVRPLEGALRAEKKFRKSVKEIERKMQQQKGLGNEQAS
jgi:hypothetical protein